MGADMRNLTHLSYSSVSLWHQCPRAWYLKYRLGITGPPTAAQIYGTAMHQTVQDALVNRIHMNAAADNFKDNFVHEMKLRRADLTDRDMMYHIELGRETLLDPFSAELFKSVHVCRESQIEKKIEFMVPGVPIPVLGYIDIVDDAGHIYYIKTSRTDWSQERADTGTQVDFYLTAQDSLGDHRHGGKFTYIIMTKTRPTVYFLDTQRTNYIERVYGLVQEMWDWVKRDEIPERDDYVGDRCDRCWSVADCALND